MRATVLGLIICMCCGGCGVFDGINSGTANGIQTALNHDYQDSKGNAAQKVLGRQAASTQPF